MALQNKLFANSSGLRLDTGRLLQAPIEVRALDAYRRHREAYGGAARSYRLLDPTGTK